MYSVSALVFLQLCIKYGTVQEFQSLVFQCVVTKIYIYIYELLYVLYMCSCINHNSKKADVISVLSDTICTSAQ